MWFWTTEQEEVCFYRAELRKSPNVDPKTSGSRRINFGCACFFAQKSQISKYPICFMHCMVLKRKQCFVVSQCHCLVVWRQCDRKYNNNHSLQSFIATCILLACQLLYRKHHRHSMSHMFLECPL